MGEYLDIRSGPTTADLSIIMPNYNHARFLPEAIRSRLRQTLPPLELIIVDDASTDDSIAIIERECAHDPRVRLVRRAENGGPNVAINSGLASARGAFVCCSAADDMVAPEFVERAVSTLLRFPKAALCFMDPRMIDDETGREQSVPLALADGPTYFSPDAFEREMQSNYFTISSNTVVYRRERLDEIGGFRATLEWQSDWFTNLVLTFRHGACYVPGAPATVRIHTGTYSGIGTRQQQGQRRLLYKCLDLLAQEYSDVAPRFRRAALVPEMRLRDLGWLLTSAPHRRHISARLVMRLLARELWIIFRPLTPIGLRRLWRRLAANRVGA